MKKAQTNKMNMFEALSRTCLTYESAWSDKPIFVEAMQRFNAKVEAIQQIAAELTSGSKRATMEKKELRATLVDHYLVIAAAVKVFALKTDRKDLLHLFDKSNGYFSSCREENLIAEIRSFIEEVQVHRDELEAYGVTGEVFDRLITLRDRFGAIRSLPREIIVTNKVNNKLMSTYFDEALAILKDELDGLALQFEESHNKFFQAYTEARHIIYLKGKAGNAAIAPVKPLPPTGTERDPESLDA